MAWASWRRERLGDLSRFAWRFVISLVEVVMEAARRAKREPEETSLVELEGVARASSPRLERGPPRLAPGNPPHRFLLPFQRAHVGRVNALVVGQGQRHEQNQEKPAYHG